MHKMSRINKMKEFVHCPALTTNKQLTQKVILKTNFKKLFVEVAAKPLLCFKIKIRGEYDH